MRTGFIDLTGKRFGRWVAIKPGLGRDGEGRFYWVCRCDCGTVKEVAGRHLRRGLSSSCGCLRDEKTARRLFRHGLKDSREYTAWCNMIARCHRRGATEYHRYGARGIAVCPRWRASFVAFHEDMGPSPSADHSIDRIDNSQGYTPGNCRWATRKEQGRNTRKNRFLTLDGDRRTLAEWAERTGVPEGTIRHRLDDMGWTIKKALTTPLRESPRYAHQGKSLTLREWSQVTGITYHTLRARILRGWPVAEALTRLRHLPPLPARPRPAT